MFHQFARCGCPFWTTSQFKVLTDAFPLLLQFPHIIEYPSTYNSFREFPTTHELAHMIQFYANSESDRLLLDNFGWPPGEFFKVKDDHIAEREAEVFAIEILIQDISRAFLAGLPRSAFSLVLSRNLADNPSEEYWDNKINENVEKFKPNIVQLANDTFQFIVDHKEHFLKAVD